jgi:hypothetical protein
MSIGVIRHQLSSGTVAVLWWHSLATEVGLGTGFNQPQHLIITGYDSPSYILLYFFIIDVDFLNIFNHLFYLKYLFKYVIL